MVKIFLMNTNGTNLIFLDFETDTNGNYFIGGKKINGEFEQVVLNSELSGLATEHGFRETTPKKFVSSVFDDVAENSVVVGYSMAERDLIRGILGVDGEKKFPNLQYLNLLKVARSWIREFKKREFDALPPFRKDPKRWNYKNLRYSLASVMRLTELLPPADYAPGKTSTKFKAVLEALKKNDQNYASLTGKQKKKATECLKHNKFDVEALEVLYNECSETEDALINRQIKPLFEMEEFNIQD